MFELTINKEVYQFNFGMGFMREINKDVGAPIDGLPGVKQNIGLRFHVAALIDGDLESLVKVLCAANKNLQPRITTEILDTYIDDPDTDVDALCEKVLDFLKSANATKKVVVALLENIEKQTAKQ